MCDDLDDLLQCALCAACCYICCACCKDGGTRGSTIVQQPHPVIIQQPGYYPSPQQGYAPYNYNYGNYGIPPQQRVMGMKGGGVDPFLAYPPPSAPNYAQPPQGPPPPYPYPPTQQKF